MNLGCGVIYGVLGGFCINGQAGVFDLSNGLFVGVFGFGFGWRDH